jgi:hypothetical protein
MYNVYIYRAFEIIFLITTLKLGYEYLIFFGIISNIIGNTLHYQMYWYTAATVTRLEKYKKAETLILSLFSSVGHVGKKSL